MYGLTGTVTLADGSAVDAFETLESHTSLSEAADLLQQLGVDDDQLKGVVAAWALRQAGLD